MRRERRRCAHDDHEGEGERHIARRVAHGHAPHTQLQALMLLDERLLATLHTHPAAMLPHQPHVPPSPAPVIIRICLQSAQMVERLPLAHKQMDALRAELERRNAERAAAQLLAFLKTMREDHSNPPPFVVNV